MVTMKRKTYSGLQVVLSGLACGLLGFLCYWVIVRYGRGKFYGTDSGAASFGWLLLSFLVVVLFMQSISLFFGLLIRVIQRLLTEEKEHIRWMDRTFQLAWLQLKTGDRERAMENLRLVAGRAGTMAIRKKAEELLKA